MMGHASSLFERLPLETHKEIDRLCTAFELAWTQGQAPKLEEYLTLQSPDADRLLFRELLRIEWDCRRRLGENPTLRDYTTQFPEQADLISTMREESFLPDPPLPIQITTTENACRQLRRGMIIFAVVGALVLGIFTLQRILELQNNITRPAAGMVGATLLISCWITFVVALVILLRLKRSSLTPLRRIDVVAIAMATIYATHFRYVNLAHLPLESLSHPAEQSLQTLVTLLHCNLLSILMIAVYGLCIRQPWKRCLFMVAPVVVLAVAATILASRSNPVLDSQLVFYLTPTILGHLMVTALVVFIAFRIGSLEQQVVEAQEKFREVGQYRLKELLGAGGMGEVYLAEHLLLKQPCAVKLIRPERAGDSQILRRFEREVQVTARLQHWNTVQIFDYGHAADGTFYYVMEYLPGLSLDELVKQYGPLPPERVVYLLRQVCAALREAHAHGLIHRDLKPANIMVCERGGQSDVAKLLDFGLVGTNKLRGQSENSIEGVLAGTPAYMSPEQAAGDEQVDARSDLYSLGAVSYFLLSGKPPFSERNAMRTLLAHLHENVESLGANGVALPQDLEAIVMRCLEKDRHNRFQDVAELDQALAACRCESQWTEEKARRWWKTDPVISSQ